jgi:hypothetical protein
MGLTSAEAGVLTYETFEWISVSESIIRCFEKVCGEVEATKPEKNGYFSKVKNRRDGLLLIESN